MNVYPYPRVIDLFNKEKHVLMFQFSSSTTDNGINDILEAFTPLLPHYTHATERFCHMEVEKMDSAMRKAVVECMTGSYKEWTS